MALKRADCVVDLRSTNKFLSLGTGLLRLEVQDSSLLDVVVGQGLVVLHGLLLALQDLVGRLNRDEFLVDQQCSRQGPYLRTWVCNTDLLSIRGPY